jgi:hypothetical protein
MPAPASNGKVQFGSTVTILRDDGRRQTWRIVGEDEAEPAKGTLSYVSPVARALMNKSMGDAIVAGSGEAEIVAISLSALMPRARPDQPGSRPRPAAPSSSRETIGAAGVEGHAGECGNCRMMQIDCFSIARRGRPIAWRSSNRMTCASGMAASCLHVYWSRERGRRSVTGVTFTAICRRA